MSCFSQLFSQTESYKSAKYDVENNRFPFGITGLPATAKALFIHTVLTEHPQRAAVIVRNEGEAQQLAEDLNGFGTPSVIFPERDFMFRTNDTASAEYEQRRIGALVNLMTDERCVVIMSADAAAQRTIPPAYLKKCLFTLKRGEDADIREIRYLLNRNGYTVTQQVEGPGQYAVRGGIVDIYPAQTQNPIRVDFWDTQIDDIAYFDIITQRRMDSLDSVLITPVTEVPVYDHAELAQKIDGLLASVKGKRNEDMVRNFTADSEHLHSGISLRCYDRYLPLIFEENATVLDYIEDGLVFVCDSGEVAKTLRDSDKMFDEEYRSCLTAGLLCRALGPYRDTSERIFERYSLMRTVYTDNFPRGSFDTPVKDLASFSVNQHSSWDGSCKALYEDLPHYCENGYTIIVMCGSEKAAQGTSEQLESEGYHAALQSGNSFNAPHGSFFVIPGAVTHGLEIPGLNFLLVSYGRFAKTRTYRALKRKKTANTYNSIEELKPGDFVVHETYGIGQFKAIEQIEFDGVKKDYITIIYAKGDKLQIPITKLEMISKYVGPKSEDNAKPVKLSSLSSSVWEKTKARVRENVQDVARELVEIYARRLDAPGHAFSEDIDMQNDFERRFEYDETDDQLRSTAEIKHDMEQPHPMDRLLCGDVGFGKTEVALRAAFKCICDGKQVAFLVPTTILALQHYRTILHRFEGFPIEADMLCRFRTPREQKETIKKLADGRVDIVTATHRLLSKDIRFKDLGLLIVDEEQRFGVIQKDKIKKMFPGVDVLTLTATPIPRTLNQSLAGIKDLSSLDEAPMDRSPVQTYVFQYDLGVITEAIGKELRRGGQVYYLKNNIADLPRIAAVLGAEFPEARIGIGHGQMDEEALSDVWQGMTEHDLDILVCTTIIETGVDVPNVNTIIIDGADRMGLAQLHQLRGRVGRSSRKGYAYLTYNNEATLGIDAEKRLATIREFTQFGSGLKIAMRDMEIRGVGELLGAKQHGMLENVGYDMYMEILNEEIERIKNEHNPEYSAPVKCQIDLRVNAYIPDDYISQYSQKIAMYKRIADIKNDEDGSDVLDELIDRYGEPPACVMGLIDVAVIKNAMARYDIHEIRQKQNNIFLLTNAPKKSLFKAMCTFMPGRIQFGSRPGSYYTIMLKPGEDQIETLRALADYLGRQTNEAE